LMLWRAGPGKFQRPVAIEGAEPLAANLLSPRRAFKEGPANVQACGAP